VICVFVCDLLITTVLKDFVNEAVRGSVLKLADRGYPQRTASLKMLFKTLL
jgi:hypothetical protein